MVLYPLPEGATMSTVSSIRARDPPFHTTEKGGGDGGNVGGEEGGFFGGGKGGGIDGEGDWM